MGEQDGQLRLWTPDRVQRGREGDGKGKRGRTSGEGNGKEKVRWDMVAVPQKRNLKG